MGTQYLKVYIIKKIKRHEFNLQLASAQRKTLKSVKRRQTVTQMTTKAENIQVHNVLFLLFATLSSDTLRCNHEEIESLSFDFASFKLFLLLKRTNVIFFCAQEHLCEANSKPLLYHNTIRVVQSVIYGSIQKHMQPMYRTPPTLTGSS